MIENRGTEYWKNRIKYYRRKYGKDSIEVKAARLNLQKALTEGGKKWTRSTRT